MRAASLCLVLTGLATVVAADEGMWTFDRLPTTLLAEKHGFTPTAEWTQRVRDASVRFNDGGSGSFVSPDGLMITNHHIGLNCIQNVSTAENDYVTGGFMAATREAEKPCPGYEVNILTGMEDVSARMHGAITPRMTDWQVADALKGETARLQTECATRTGQRCDVVKLYGGSEYQLYAYRKYTDVRLVMAPEQQIAFFGGDPDNFTYPRHDLDISFFRAYEGGRPVRPAAWLRWSPSGAADGEVVFVSGNPGSTSRLLTMAQLESERDFIQPDTLGRLAHRREVLAAYADKAPENSRRVKATIHSLENSLKGLEGRLEALKDREAMARLRAAEKELRSRIQKDPKLVAAVGTAFADLAAAQKREEALIKEIRFVSFAGSRLLTIAGYVLRHAVETRKPNEERLEEFNDANLASLENAMFSRAPIYPDVEELTLADQLRIARETLGPAHPFVRAVLGARTPMAVAREAVSGTRLADVEVRRTLVNGGPAAVHASTDSMIVLARTIDPLARPVRQKREELEAAQVRASEKIASASFAVYGRTAPPDATFTPRLSFGVVKGYPSGGTQVPAHTTFHGLYDRSASFGDKPPWNLPPRWKEKKKELELETPLDFVSTADIIGGSSGSPTINRAGEIVGIIFDTNMEALAWDYYFDDARGRAVSVDSRGILEALLKVYGAHALAEELTANR
jgi:hypothetical protein